MSSRRAVGEDNILAMLERDSARRTGTRASNLRLACYGAAAAFAGILIGGVAWLAYDNYKTAERLQAGHDALVVAPQVVASTDPLPPPAPPMLTAPDAAPVAPAADAPRAAVIVDEPAPPLRTVPDSLPPLVMLPPEKAPARAASKPASRPPKETVNRPAPALAGDRRKADKKVEKKVEKKAETKALKKTDKKVDKAQRTAKRTAKPAPPRATAKAAASTVRERKSVSAAPQVDTDVALISAIISQSERHRREREAAAACQGAKCPPKAAQP